MSACSLHVPLLPVLLSEPLASLQGSCRTCSVARSCLPVLSPPRPLRQTCGQTYTCWPVLEGLGICQGAGSGR